MSYFFEWLLESIFKLLVVIFGILLIIFIMCLYRGNSYRNRANGKVKTIEFIVGENNDKFEILLEVDGEIIFKNDKLFIEGDKN